MELSAEWEYVADGVMGGESDGRMVREDVSGRPAHRLIGDVSLENDGGFIQMAFDLAGDGGAVDASAFSAVELDVLGNGEVYDLRLRTTDLEKPWQSFRAEFTAPPTWTTQRIAFADLDAHKTDARFDPRHLRRIGVLAIGRVFHADLAVAAVRLV